MVDKQKVAALAALVLEEFGSDISDTDFTDAVQMVNAEHDILLWADRNFWMVLVRKSYLGQES